MLVTGLLLCALAACATAPLSEEARPTSWAQPVALDGVPNLHRVYGGLYRGGQPTARGFEALAASGIKTVVSLRHFHDDTALLAGTGLRSERVPLDAGDVTEDEVIAALRVLTRSDIGPVFVHCEFGSDRAGAVIAAYRVVVERWSRDEAIAEMTRGGFGFHWIYSNLVGLIRALDVERVRREIADRGRETNP